MKDGKRIGVLGKIGLVIAGIALIASVSATAQLKLEMNRNHSEFSELKEELEIVNRKLVKLSAKIVEMKKLREDI